MGLHATANASIVAQGTHPGSALPYRKEVWRVWQGQPRQGSLHIIAEMTGEPAS